MARRINWFGRALGLVCAACLASAWAFVLWVPSAGADIGRHQRRRRRSCSSRWPCSPASPPCTATRSVIALLFLASFFPIGVSCCRGITGSNGSAGSILGCSSRRADLATQAPRATWRLERDCAHVGGCSRMAASFGRVHGASTMREPMASDTAGGSHDLAGSVRARGRLRRWCEADARQAARRLDRQRSARVRAQLRALGYGDANSCTILRAAAVAAMALALGALPAFADAELDGARARWQAAALGRLRVRLSQVLRVPSRLAARDDRHGERRHGRRRAAPARRQRRRRCRRPTRTSSTTGR